MMKFLNYRSNKEITFENRLHFTTDRNMTSPYFQDITGQIAGSKITEKEVILNKIKADGKRLIDINWEKEIVIKYIPNEYVAGELLDNLPEALGIAFIRGEEDAKIGLDVVHEGFLFDGKDFIHSSSAQGEVVRVNFLDYYFNDSGNAKFDGMMLFEVK